MPTSLPTVLTLVGLTTLDFMALVWSNPKPTNDSLFNQQKQSSHIKKSAKAQIQKSKAAECYASVELVMMKEEKKE